MASVFFNFTFFHHTLRTDLENVVLQSHLGAQAKFYMVVFRLFGNEDSKECVHRKKKVNKFLNNYNSSMENILSTIYCQKKE
jgi:hypothetical protein